MASPKNKRKEADKTHKKAQVKKNKISAINRELTRNPNNSGARNSLVKWQAQ